MSLLNDLSDSKIWDKYRDYKVSGQHISKYELKKLDDFIADKRYLYYAKHIFDEKIPFDYPCKRTVNKSGTDKKRVVYTYSDDEMLVLKLIMYRLRKYENKFSPSCYSFRSNRTVKGAIRKIITSSYVRDSYIYKADIHNYFNSMDAELLIRSISEVIDDDSELVIFLSKLLRVNKAYDQEGNIIEEARGGMAGIPISPFFANVYLKAVDDMFSDVPYYRYSDDILIFAPDKDALDSYKAKFESAISSANLELNPDKVSVTEPGRPWEFLGFKYINGKMDISDVAVNKIKAKIKRKAAKLYRWRCKKNVSFDSTAKVMIRVFNRKFYGCDTENSEEETDDFTWCRWFFPVIDTAASLKVIDEYLVEYIRYLSSGRHYKGNYKITYEHIKELGFRSLVNEYYRYKDESKSA